MLEAAKALGVEVRQARAVDLEFHDSKAIVYTENAPVECDVVVGAFGLDEASAAMFSRATPYRSPDALLSIVTKYHPPPEFMEDFGALIHAFIPADRGIEFAGITPKGDHLTINIAGRKVNAPTMDKFLSKPKVAALLGNPTVPNRRNPGDWRYFKGRFPCELAKKYYGHRYVMTGDAAGLVRPFKGKGVTAAIHSGIRAANTIVNAGVTSKAFHDDYRTANQDILKDLLWGRTARLATLAMSEVGLLNVIVRAGKKNANTYAALLGAVSAHASYRTVFRRAFSIGSLKAIALSLLRPDRT
jgi:flavin-dependent dehydrogenase